MATDLIEDLAFHGGSSFSAKSYAAAVKRMAKTVLRYAREDGAAYGSDAFVDWANGTYLLGDTAVRQVLAFSSNLYNVSMDDIEDTLAMAQMEPENRQVEFMGNVAYRAFEQDLWDALRALLGIGDDEEA